jgi:hypothetical protein
MTALQSQLPRERYLSGERRRALEILAVAGLGGCTGATLLGHGFRTGMLADLVRDGLAVRVCGWANARSRWLASGSRTQDRRRSKVDRDRRGNAPMRPALDSGVRLANELHAAPALIAHSLPKGPGPQM